MNPNGHHCAGADLIDRLAAFDDALAIGDDPASPFAGPEDDPLGPDEARRALDAVDCIRLLRRAWPGPGPTTGGDGAGERSGAPPTTVGPVHGAEVDDSFVVRPGPVASVPGFEILEEVGRGGMGIVYKARQASLNRDVALKFLPPSRVTSAAALDCFRKEAMAAASVQHAGVLPVHDILEVDGVPAIVMPFVAGDDLGRIIRDRRDVREGARAAGRHPWAEINDREYLDRILPALDQLIEAVAEVHRAGVLHRDIKPSNVLVDARGKVHVTDFGLARLDGDPTLRRAQFLGTPGYMAPEQWSRRYDIDRRADLFGLGATVYEALSLAMPHGRSRIAETAPAAAPMSSVQPLISAAFDGVVGRAIEPDRERRYASVDAFHADWARARQGQRHWDRRTRWGLAEPARAHHYRRSGLVELAIGAVVIAGLVAGTWRFVPGPRLDAPAVPGGKAPLTFLRSVAIETRPSGARVVLVPLDPRDGGPVASKAIRPRSPSPLVADHVPPGDYLVVAALPDGRFHEVFRHVAKSGEPPVGDEGVYNHHLWQERPDGVLKLPKVMIPDIDVAAGMAEFAGGPAFQVGDARWPQLAPVGAVDLAPFYLDIHEVTVERYLEVAAALPPLMRGAVSDPKDPVRGVTWDEAAHYAEERGCRLPTEAEYEYAATAGGTRPFPWGDDASPLTHGAWRIGRVGVPEWDQTATVPPVFGLFSNVAEWTSGAFRPTGDRNPSRVDPPDTEGDRPVRGGPFAVVEGRGGNDPEAAGAGPRWRQTIRHDARYPGLGFRYARSVRPRFLGP